MADYPTQPSPFAGTSLLGQRLDPTTWYLFNQPPAPSPTTTTTLPQADPGAAYAAGLPDFLQSYAQTMGDLHEFLGQAPAPISRHEHFQYLRDLNSMLRSGAPPEVTFPLLQQMMDQGTLYGTNPGLGTAVPFGGGGPRTQRLIDAYERYQDYLSAGNPPQYNMVPHILGTIPPEVGR